MHLLERDSSSQLHPPRRPGRGGRAEEGRAAALRASEINADVILKATKVDGIYDSDPKKNPNARRFEQINFREALARQLKVMDSTAFSLCMDNHKPIIVFDMHQPDNIRKALAGDPIGTLVNNGPTLPAELAMPA